MGRSAFLIALAIVVHAIFPRYGRHSLQGFTVARVDRWTGRAETTMVLDDGAVPWLQVRHGPAEGPRKSPNATSTTEMVDYIFGRETPALAAGDSQPRIAALYAAVAELQDPAKKAHLRELGLDPAALERYFRARIAEHQRQR